MDVTTGHFIPARCDRLNCYACVIPVAIQLGQAIAMARPSLWFTVTDLADSWSEAGAAMAKLRRKLANLGGVGHWAYHLEHNPGREGSHAHVWWRGDDISKDALALAAETAGAGRHVALGRAFAATNSYERPTIDYGMKAVLVHRPEAPSAMWPEAAAFLKLNGGSLVHTSQGFWEDWTGQRLAGNREARVVAHRGKSTAQWRYSAVRSQPHAR